MKMHVLADAFAGSLPQGLIEYDRLQRQVLDITFPAAPSIERGMDRHSEMAVTKK